LPRLGRGFNDLMVSLHCHGGLDLLSDVGRQPLPSTQATRDFP
jgi:hypothetical protein